MAQKNRREENEREKSERIPCELAKRGSCQVDAGPKRACELKGYDISDM
jgi:hypothetical protein